MRCQIQLRVCNASTKANALVRNARRIGWKAGELRDFPFLGHASAPVFQKKIFVRDCAEIVLFRLWARNVPIPRDFCGGYRNARVPVLGGVPARSRKIFHFWVAYIIPPLYIMGGGLREKFRFRGVLGGVRAGVQVREFGDTAGCRKKPGTT